MQTHPETETAKAKAGNWQAYSDYWNRHAANVGPVKAVTHLNPEEYQELYAHVLSSLVTFTPDRVIDLACGPGLIVPTVLGFWPDARYIGLDLGVAMIDKAMQTYQNRYPQVSFQQMLEPVIHLGPEPNRRTLLLCHSLMTHITPEDARDYMREISRAIGEYDLAIISIHTNCDSGVRGNVGRVDYEPAFFEDMLYEEGLEIEAFVETIQCYYGVRNA